MKESADDSPLTTGERSMQAPLLHTAPAKWSLTPAAFEKLLACFSSDRDQAAAQYEIVRSKLVRFFEWRSVTLAEGRADDTLDRVARRIDEGVFIDNIKSYVYGVARMVLKEAMKEREHAPLVLENMPDTAQKEDIELTESERRLECFDHCLDSLPDQSRFLIMEYHKEERRAKIELRMQLATQLKIPLNALRIRAHRIRLTLETCINTCLEQPASTK